MRANLKSLAIAAAFALPAVIVGCRAGYDVDVRNLTDQPVHARLVTPFGDGADQTLREIRLGPRNHGSMFVQTDFNQHIALSVDSAANTLGYPATLDLSRGKTIVNVSRVGEAAKGPLRLQQVPRP
jgi:hypothetical protein